MKTFSLKLNYINKYKKNLKKQCYAGLFYFKENY